MARQQIGQLRANYGASGVAIEGSPLDLLEQSARNAELDRLTIINQGALQATAYRNQAALDRSQGRSALASGGISAAGTLLQTAGDLYTNWPGSGGDITATRNAQYGGYYTGVPTLKLVG